MESLSLFWKRPNSAKGFGYISFKNTLSYQALVDNEKLQVWRLKGVWGCIVIKNSNMICVAQPPLSKPLSFSLISWISYLFSRMNYKIETNPTVPSTSMPTANSLATSPNLRQMEFEIFFQQPVNLFFAIPDPQSPNHKNPISVVVIDASCRTGIKVVSLKRSWPVGPHCGPVYLSLTASCDEFASKTSN